MHARRFRRRRRRGARSTQTSSRASTGTFDAVCCRRLQQKKFNRKCCRSDCSHASSLHADPSAFFGARLASASRIPRPLSFSGKTITKAAESWDELNVNVRYRKNENFRRIRATTLMRLLQDKENPEVRGRDNERTAALARARAGPRVRERSAPHPSAILARKFD